MHKVNVSGIPRWTSERDLKNFFHSCGTIVRADILDDVLSIQSHCDGSITFANESGAKKALEKNEALLDGAQIKVYE